MRTRKQESLDSVTLSVGFDSRFAYPALVTIYSVHTRIRSTNRWVLGVIDGQLSASDASIVTQTLSMLGISHEIRTYPDHELFTERRHLSKSTFLKLRLSDDVDGPLIWFDTDMCAVSDASELVRQVASSGPDTKLVVAEFNSEEFNAGLLGWTNSTRMPWEQALASLPSERTGSEQPLFNSLYGSSKKVIPAKYNSIWSWLIPGPQKLPDPVVVHFTGGYKPWHLPPKFRHFCSIDQCPWHFWFECESQMLESLGDKASIVGGLRNRSLTTARPHKGPGYLGFLFARFINKLGPLSVPFVNLLRRFRAHLPFALHPIHGLIVNLRDSHRREL